MCVGGLDGLGTNMLGAAQFLCGHVSDLLDWCGRSLHSLMSDSIIQPRVDDMRLVLAPLSSEPQPPPVLPRRTSELAAAQNCARPALCRVRQRRGGQVQAQRRGTSVLEALVLDRPGGHSGVGSFVQCVRALLLHAASSQQVVSLF